MLSASTLRYLSATPLALAPAAPLRCLVVDGDPGAAAALAACVQQVPQLALAGSYTSPARAVAHLRTQPIDVLFLPLELPLLVGFELLCAPDNSPAVVLTSDFIDYNLQRHGTYGVVDSLPQPFCPAHFRQVAGRLQTQRGAPAPLLASGTFSRPRTDGLYLWVNQQLVQLRLTDLLYAEDLGDRTRLKTLRQEVVVEEPFAALATQLPEPQFLRLNPTCIVAPSHATAVAGNTLAIGGRHFAVGPALQDEILARVFQTSFWGA